MTVAEREIAATAEEEPRSTQASAVGDLLRPELVSELSDLDDEEQALIALMVRRAKTDRGRRVPLTDVSLVHESLKIDPENDDFSVMENPAKYTAPPVLKEYPGVEKVPLPKDFLPLDFPLKEVITKRASRRDFSKGPVTLKELSTVLYYGWGVRDRMIAYNVRGFPTRFAPSMGGLQSVEVYFTVNAVNGLEQGLYHYSPGDHSLHFLNRGNFRRIVVRSTLFQDWVDAASVVFFLTCDMNKVYWKYGRRAYRFVHVDLGVTAHNLHLVANASRLRTCMMAAFVEDSIHELLEIDGRDEFAGLLMAMGRKPSELDPPPDD